MSPADAPLPLLPALALALAAFPWLAGQLPAGQPTAGAPAAASGAPGGAPGGTGAAPVYHGPEPLVVRPKPTPMTKKKRGRDTSSSSGEKSDPDKTDKTASLDMTADSGSSDSKSGDSRGKGNKKKYEPKSSIETRGWRKWHRKCTRCPDLITKYRQPYIEWICGAYQRARRSFKSRCMMYYRNCQDGTMFTKVHNGRCKNDSLNETLPHGEHFFYDYMVELTDESSDSDSDQSESSDSSSSSKSVSSD